MRGRSLRTSLIVVITTATLMVFSGCAQLFLPEGFILVQLENYSTADVEIMFGSSGEQPDYFSGVIPASDDDSAATEGSVAIPTGQELVAWFDAAPNLARVHVANIEPETWNFNEYDSYIVVIAEVIYENPTGNFSDAFASMTWDLIVNGRSVPADAL